MVMLEKNNLDIAHLIDDWVVQNTRSQTHWQLQKAS
jgi:hypothetical protein